MAHNASSPYSIEPGPASSLKTIAAGAPTQEVINAIEGGWAKITRRVEFYESDWQTRWFPEGSASAAEPRLISGSVSLDQSRDERRSVDLTLDNQDNLLRPNPEDGFWYDKNVKVFRGVRYSTHYSRPRVCIIESNNLDTAYDFKLVLGRFGYGDIDVNLDIVTLEEASVYDILVSILIASPTMKSDLLKQAYDSGKKILTLSAGNTNAEIPFVVTVTSPATRNTGITPMSVDTPLNAGWSAEAYGSRGSVSAVTAVAATATVVATYFDGSVTNLIGAIEANAAQGRWFNLQVWKFGPQGRILLANGMRWLEDIKPYKTWEAQVGSFGVENIGWDYEPKSIHVTGRDFTAKGLRSAFEENESFEAGTKIADFALAVATNYGATKFDIADTADALVHRVDFEKGTARFTAIKDLVTPFGYEVFHAADDTFVMRKFLDPTTSPISWTFQTGINGNLATFSRSTDDSRIFNHIIVTGTQDKGLPFFGEAINNEPSSPTRVEKLGDRPYFFDAGTFESDEQCARYARQLLKIMALESYEIDFGSFVYPWLDVGSIVKFLDPERFDFEPTRFLMDTLTIPLGLEPLQATGKRVTFVDDSELQGIF